MDYESHQYIHHVHGKTSARYQLHTVGVGKLKTVFSNNHINLHLVNVCHETRYMKRNYQDGLLISIHI